MLKSSIGHLKLNHDQKIISPVLLLAAQTTCLVNSDQCDSTAVVILKDHPVVLKSTKFLGIVTNSLSRPLMRNFDLVTLCQTSASFHVPLCPETFTAIEAVPLPVISPDLLQCQVRAVLHDPFKPSKPVLQ